MDRRQRLALIALFVLGIALRLYLNDVNIFSLADETRYLDHARELAGGFLAGFPRFASGYAADPNSWVWPPPMRWAHWALIANACALARDCNYSTLTFISTLGGIAALSFTWLLGSELIGRKPALVAVGLALASPLQLHLGRRALQDEVACAATLAALWAVVRALSLSPRDSNSRRRGLGPHTLAVVICTLALAEKETALLWAPALFAIWIARHRARGWRREDLLLLLSPILYFGIFCILARSTTIFFQDAQANLGSLDTSGYVAQSMSGPGYRYLYDLFILAPAPFLLGTAAVGAIALARPAAANPISKPGSKRDPNPNPNPTADADRLRGARELALLLFIGLAVWAGTPKDVRYLAAADSIFCILAAWFLVAYTQRFRAANLLLAAALSLNFIYQAHLFQRIFIERAVYDPTTFEILKALDSVPREK